MFDFVQSEHIEASLELHYGSSEGADGELQTWAAPKTPMFSTFLSETWTVSMELCALVLFNLSSFAFVVRFHALSHCMVVYS